MNCQNGSGIATYCGRRAGYSSSQKDTTKYDLDPRGDNTRVTAITNILDVSITMYLVSWSAGHPMSRLNHSKYEKSCPNER